MNKLLSKFAPLFEPAPAFEMQAHRLIQIIWVSTGSVFVAIIFFAIYGWNWGVPNLIAIGALVLFIGCIWLANQKKTLLATTIFIATLTMFAFSLIFMADGLNDEAISILPAILLFACMFGTRLQFYVLLFSIISFLGMVVIADHMGWHKIPVAFNTTLPGFINVSLILSGGGFFSYVLASDLRRALAELHKSKNELQELNSQLELRISQRTEEVENANRALQVSMENLEKAMDELVRSEKLASLGSMVAGISHELNTPIGNTLLAASNMENLFESVSNDVRNGNMKRSMFDDFIKEGRELSALIIRSTKRSSELVSGFKQISITETLEHRRIFDLRELVEENIKVLMPNFRNVQIKVINQVATNVELESYPGSLGTILTNLIQNAILHGFEGKHSGSIIIEAENRPDHVVLTVRDDGAGMPQHVIAHAFDPFFTTKMGQGGSGLGLSISHRIATSILGGDMKLVSSYGNGTTFIIELPKLAPVLN